MNIRCYFRVPFVVKSVFIRGFLKKQLFSAYFFFTTNAHEFLYE
jgi:hypothetical protein